MKTKDNYIRLRTGYDKFEVFNLPHKSTEPVCKSLRVLLKTQSRSYYNIATSVGISPTQIHRILTSKIKLPSKRHLELLAKALEVNPEYFAEYRILRIVDYLLDNIHNIDTIYNKFL